MLQACELCSSALGGAGYEGLPQLVAVKGLGGVRPINGHYVLSMEEPRIVCGKLRCGFSNFVVLLYAGVLWILLPVAKSSSDDMRAGESRLHGPFASPPPPFLPRDSTRHTCTPYMRSSSIPGSPNLDLLKDQAPWFSIRALT